MPCGSVSVFGQAVGENPRKEGIARVILLDTGGPRSSVTVQTACSPYKKKGTTRLGA